MKDDSGHSPILTINPLAPEPNLITVAAMALKSGRTLVFPTDTVYGIGLLAQKTATPDSIFRLKQRDGDKAVPLLIDSVQALDKYSQDLPQYARELAQRFWPGSLTLVVQASAALPKQFLAADGSVALRMPNNQIALDLLVKVDSPIATSSANLQGQPPATSIDTLEPCLGSSVALLIDGGKIQNARPSTIISCLGAEPIVLREGSIIL
ncbi:threonylcarbamoyl-AMP synthase [Actinomycetota bacterium]|nr:threonylcarbamoyl-AMP synthase [Actinomycetota bacterium]